jgi:hypothetical protein
VVRSRKRPFRKGSKKGRPLKFDPYEYAQYIVFADLQDWSYRDAEASAMLYLGASLDHSTFGKVFQRISLDYMKKLRRLLRSLILCTGMQFVRIADSTGIETDRYEVVRKLYKERKKRHLKRHIISNYCEEFGVSVIEASAMTDGYANDSPQLRAMVKEEGCRGGTLLADRGYDHEKNRLFCEQRNIKPVIKLRGKVQFPNMVQEAVYKSLRGMVETVFGGYESWKGNKTRMRLRETQALDIEMMSVSQMVRTYFKILEVEKLVMKLINLIFRQPHKGPGVLYKLFQRF